MSDTVKITAIITSGIVAVVAVLLAWNAYRTQIFIAGGYTRDTVKGEPLTQWVLPVN